MLENRYIADVDNEKGYHADLLAEADRIRQAGAQGSPAKAQSVEKKRGALRFLSEIGKGIKNHILAHPPGVSVHDGFAD